MSVTRTSVTKTKPAKTGARVMTRKAEVSVKHRQVTPGVSRGAGVVTKMNIPGKAQAKKNLPPGERFLGRLRKTCEQAVEQAQRAGRSIRVSVDVGPDGSLEISQTEVVTDLRADMSAAANKTDLETALASARRRGQLRVAEILAGADMLNAADMAVLLGTTRATVNNKRHDHQLLGLDGAKRGFRFPAWQIGEDGKPFAALPALFECFGNSEWAVYRFLVQRHPELKGRTGLDALRAGHVAQVIEVAESVARASA